jgi:hypothetical protein
MLQRPPASAPTSDDEALDVDGTPTDRLVDTYRFRLLASNDNLNGGVGFDDRGQAQWKWVTDVGDIDDSGTFEQLRALDNPALSLEEEVEAPPPEPEPSREAGYNPYSTGVFEKPKARR